MPEQPPTMTATEKLEASVREYVKKYGGVRYEKSFPTTLLSCLLSAKPRTEEQLSQDEYEGIVPEGWLPEALSLELLSATPKRGEEQSRLALIDRISSLLATADTEYDIDARED